MDCQQKSLILECTDEVKRNLPIGLSSATSRRIAEMNEDCLLEIFSVRSLDLIDLCSIAETCSEFQQIAEQIFPKKFALEKNEVYIVDSEKYYGQKLEKSDVERVMMNFGWVVSDFSISERISRCRRERPILDRVFMDAVRRNCFDNLKSLQIYGFKLPAVCTDKFKNMFKRLQLLDLQWVTASDATLFEGLDSLTELRVMQVESSKVILENFFPKLERFTYFTTDIRTTDSIRHANLGQSFETLISFISRHNCLKGLDLCFYSHPACFKILLEAIGNSCKNLIELWIRVGLSTFTSAHLQPLQKFQSLRTLGLSEVPCGNLQFISGRTELRELLLNGCSLPVHLDHFDALTQLTKLAINYCKTSDGFDVVHMIGRLKNLKELVISWLYIQSNKFQLDKNAFDRIVDVVMDRPQNLTLKCEFYFDLNSSEQCPKIDLFYYVGD